MLWRILGRKLVHLTQPNSSGAAAKYFETCIVRYKLRRMLTATYGGGELGLGFCTEQEMLGSFHIIESPLSDAPPKNGCSLDCKNHRAL